MSIKSLRVAFVRALTADLRSPGGRGKQHFVLLVGNEDDLLKKGDLMFESRKTSYYQEDINSK